MDLKTLIEKLLTVAPPGAVVKVRGLGTQEIVGVWYDEHTKTIIIQGG